MATRTQQTQFEGTIETCCHNITFRYWGFDHELTPELEAELTEHAEDHAKSCIVEGYCSGELNCPYHTECDGSDEEEIYGWWEIERN